MTKPHDCIFYLNLTRIFSCFLFQDRSPQLQQRFLCQFYYSLFQINLIISDILNEFGKLEVLTFLFSECIRSSKYFFNAEEDKAVIYFFLCALYLDLLSFANINNQMGKICSSPRSVLLSSQVKSNQDNLIESSQLNGYNLMTDWNTSNYADQKDVQGIKVKLLTEDEMNSYQIHKLIGLLICRTTSTSKAIYGTGVLISPNLVLTSAHNVKWVRRKDFPSPEIQFYPGINGTVGQCIKGQASTYPDEYDYQGRTKHDFALIKLRKEVAIDNRPCLSINFNDTTSEISIFGYPRKDNLQSNLDRTLKKVFQKGLTGKGPKSIENNHLVYQISTESGMSGCPILTGQKRKYIIGIHKGGPEKQEKQWNVGLRITYGMILQLQLMRERMGGKPFKVYDCHQHSELNIHQDDSFLSAKQILRSQQTENIRLQDKMLTEQNKIAQYWTPKGVSLEQMLRKIKELENKNKQLQQRIQKPARDNNQVQLQNLAQQPDLTVTPDNNQSQIMYLNSSDPHNPQLLVQPYTLIWNQQCQDVNRFKMDQGTLTLKKRGKKAEITSSFSLPLQQTTIKFKILCIGGNHSIQFGIKTKIDSFEKKDSIQLLQNFKLKSNNSSKVTDKGGVIEMRVDFTARYKRSTMFYMSEDFIENKTFVVCQMTNFNDSIQILPNS